MPLSLSANDPKLPVCTFKNPAPLIYSHFQVFARATTAVYFQNYFDHDLTMESTTVSIEEEALKKANDQLYETQFFGFTPQSCSDGRA